MTQETIQEINLIKIQALQDTIEQEPNIEFIGFSYNYWMINTVANDKNYITPIIVKLDSMIDIDSTISVLLREIKND